MITAVNTSILLDVLVDADGAIIRHFTMIDLLDGQRSLFYYISTAMRQ